MKTKPEQHIIEKVLNNVATPEETRQVVRWFGTEKGQAWLSKRMDIDKEKIEEGTETTYIDHPIPSEKIYENIIHTVRQKKIRRFILTVAAIVVPFILFAGLFIELNSRIDLFGTTEYNEIFVPRGKQIQLLFQDGSIAYLNSETYLRYPRKFGLTKRKVELKGEGWFEVTEHKGYPFIVHTDELEIKVLGTTFNVKGYAEDPYITITQETGNIRLTGNTFTPFTVNPGEKVIYNKTTGNCRIVRPENIKDASVWKESKLLFSDISLSEIITILKRSFDISFEIVDSEALKYHYTLQTDGTELEKIIWELEKISPVRFDKQDNKIRVWIDK